ncbi:M1-specific T cell receptor beta chain-like, partial [Etheostoma cragini]|uniref:M1-specific T cell receptor beta chain-like n=1 Tax=Etheostoma cragini TaxID=417921 RepID=UPI00155E1196
HGLFISAGLSPSQSKDVDQSPVNLLGGVNDTVNLTCKHSIKNYDTVLWYHRSQGDSSLKLVGLTSYKSVHMVENPYQGSFKVSGNGEREAFLHFLKLRHPEDSGHYFCAAYSRTTIENPKFPYKNPRVTLYTWGKPHQTFSPAQFGAGTKLTVLDPNRTITPPTVKVLPLPPNECQINKDKKPEKPKKTLVCVASRFYPDHVTVFWQIDGVDVTDGVATDDAARWGGEHYSISSRLMVPLRDWFTPGKTFTCTVSFFNGNDTVPRSDWVQGPGAAPIREKYLRITQTAKLFYAILISKSSVFGVFVVVLVWRLQGSSGKQRTEG